MDQTDYFAGYEEKKPMEKKKYRVSWIELIEYAVEVEVDSREDASTEALFQSTEEHRTGWGEVETDSIEVKEVK